ncbi:MAG: 4-hydroxythreonine-4-phosphate dehydrogenase PdxA [Leptospiraceae bacterium]|nr:4-hydroxythreonine-4-phosphate dehydrogenase PdxA [Leptospiraceae bacterium]MDW7976631.1 4-hydroxythreonine-4-phosphate dehydrogenase PdxA [Leptospiraceae bacterium]
MAKKQDKYRLHDFLFLTGGDPASISPEIIRKALSAIGENYQNLKIIYFFNSSRSEKEKIINLLKNWNVFVINKKEIKSFFESLNSITTQNQNLLILYRIGFYEKTYPTIQSAKLSFTALKEAISWIQKFGCKGLITAPISKEWIGKIEKNFSGHTRYLAKAFRTETLMIMYSKQFSVVPITEHIPIKKVPQELKRILENPKFLDLLKKLYHSYSFKKGWGITGLNPHAGDNGYIGDEEKTILLPFIKKLKKHKISIEGPLSADGLFMPEKLQNYDLIFTCYHDQGLIPFKALTGRSGVNITFGLPFLRSSPSHGTAYDIAFKEQADFTSMYHAIEIHCKKTLWS